MTTALHLAAPERELVLPPWGRFVAAAGAVTLLGAACIWGAVHASPSPRAHAIALFVHLAALIVGFGAVLSVDWAAALWMVGRREVGDVLDVAATVAVPIWGGYAGLVLSGLFLEPDVTSPVTRAKLAIVLVIGLNGVFASWVHSATVRRESPRLLVLGSLSAVVSQVCWWGATVVGFVNAH